MPVFYTDFIDCELVFFQARIVKTQRLDRPTITLGGTIYRDEAIVCLTRLSFTLKS